MLASRLLFWKSVLCRPFFMGVLISLLVSPLALADKPPDPGEQSVPVQLLMIRDTLAEMEGRLSDKLDNIQTGVNGNSTALGHIQTGVDSNGAALGGLSGQLDDRFLELMESVNSVEVTTQICLSAEFVAEMGLGEHGEAGVGWPNVLDAKLTIVEDAGLKLGSGLGEEICIQIPLYSLFVEGQLIMPTDAETQLNDLITTVSQPAMNSVVLMSYLYQQTLPPPSAVTGVIEEMIEAALTGDPKDLIDPETYYPLVPPLMEELIVAAPAIVESVINDPCAAIKSIDLLNLAAGTEFDAVCGYAADATLKVLEFIDKVVRRIVCVSTLGKWCP
jgi:hypothetical protein